MLKVPHFIRLSEKQLFLVEHVFTNFPSVPKPASFLIFSILLIRQLTIVFHFP